MNLAEEKGNRVALILHILHALCFVTIFTRLFAIFSSFFFFLLFDFSVTVASFTLLSVSGAALFV